MDERLDRIVAKLATVPYQVDRGRSRAEKGPSYPGFDLNSTLRLDEVEAFEAEHQVRLPEPYRRFITEISNGGPGPAYGLMSLADWEHGLIEITPGILQRPSPFEPDIEYGMDWWKEEGDTGEDDPWQGAITVGHQGCSDYIFLLVSGPARGRIAYANIDGHGSPYVSEDADFLSWYERWLDEMAAGHQLDFFGQNIPGDQNGLLSLIRSDPSDARRARAARSLLYLPHFDPEGTSTLIASLRSDPSSSVRTQIWHAAGQHGLQAVVPFGADALRDTDPGVRDAALRTLVGLAPPNLDEIVRFMLKDPDRDVQWTAYRIAADVGVLQSPDLITLLGSGDVEKRRTAAYHLQHVADPGREALLRTALGDDDAHVRIYAVQSISALKAVGLLPALKSMFSTETDETVGINLRRTIAQLQSAGRTETESR